MKITLSKAFGLIMVLFFAAALLFSFVAFNDWHSIALFAIGGVGFWLLFKK